MAYKLEGGIYCITCLINGRKYIGATRRFTERKYHHLYTLRKGTHRNDLLQRSFDKYGEEYFKFQVIEIVDDNELLHDKEAYWINELNTLHDGFNLTYGGESNIPSEYTRIKRSKSLTGNKNPMYGRNGELNANCKTTKSIVIKARTLIKQGIEDSKIMQECQLSISQYQKIKHNRTWKHIIV